MNHPSPLPNDIARVPFSQAHSWSRSAGCVRHPELSIGFGAQLWKLSSVRKGVSALTSHQPFAMLPMRAHPALKKGWEYGRVTGCHRGRKLDRFVAWQTVQCIAAPVRPSWKERRNFTHAGYGYRHEMGGCLVFTDFATDVPSSNRIPTGSARGGRAPAAGRSHPEEALHLDAPLTAGSMTSLVAIF